jgi:hypothetical protein
MGTASASSSQSSQDSGIDLLTLAVTAAASAAAAYACSKIWAPGTLASAAFTPVLVALIKEAMDRPARAVVQAVPVRGVVRSSHQAEAPPPAVEEVVVPRQGEVRYHSAKLGRRGWEVAIVTGLLGFLVAAIVLTVPELVGGKSIAGGDRGTTLFGGEAKQQREDPAQTTTSPTQTVTAPEPTTVTVPPPTVTETTPAPTAEEADPTKTEPSEAMPIVPQSEPVDPEAPPPPAHDPAVPDVRRR